MGVCINEAKHHTDDVLYDVPSHGCSRYETAEPGWAAYNAQVLIFLTSCVAEPYMYMAEVSAKYMRQNIILLEGQ